MAGSFNYINANAMILHLKAGSFWVIANFGWVPQIKTGQESDKKNQYQYENVVEIYFCKRQLK